MLHCDMLIIGTVTLYFIFMKVNYTLIIIFTTVSRGQWPVKSADGKHLPIETWNSKFTMTTPALEHKARESRRRARGLSGAEVKMIQKSDNCVQLMLSSWTDFNGNFTGR